MTGDYDAGRCKNSAVDISEQATHLMVPRRPESDEQSIMPSGEYDMIVDKLWRYRLMRAHLLRGQ